MALKNPKLFTVVSACALTFLHRKVIAAGDKFFKYKWAQCLIKKLDLIRIFYQTHKFLNYV